MFRVEGIEAGYGETMVLRGVSLTVPSGAVVALLGPNGAGKTTLLRVASGLLKPIAGTVVLDGENVTAAAPHHLAARGVCHVPEGRGIFPSLTVRENLLLVACEEGDRVAFDRATEAFPVLGQRMEQTAGTLSGGEQQMLSLARAYVASPQLMLLDEVSMGLAPKIVEEIFAFLRRVADGGASLLVVEQYVNQALQLADYAYLLYRGRTAFCGEAAELRGDDDVFTHYLGVETA
jgi:branched-chain amino acid transport system ATP-binding protein